MIFGEVGIIRNAEEYEERMSASARATLDAICTLAAEASVPCEKVTCAQRVALAWDS
jgi:hypothetical protein